MDWYLDGSEPTAAASLRHEVMAYLRRHGTTVSDYEAAELAVSELVTNALRHAGGPAWVSLTWGGSHPLLEVRDLGPGFDPRIELPDDPLSPAGRGLFLVSRLTPRLDVANRRAGGAVVRAELPVDRPPQASHDPPRRRRGALPTLEEADPSGGFGREPFLRALVVQLAATIEAQEGPAAAEAAVAQVGIDVGGQMEEEYRRAREVVDRLDPDQLADCFVRLKHAIDGDFHVLEVTDERIVLGNRKCPFGEAVLRAPSLCRMTSSVFGGIAARNTEHGASVVLEERLAVGDPGCRVVVHLGRPPDGTRAFAHRYESPSPA